MLRHRRRDLNSLTDDDIKRLSLIGDIDLNTAAVAIGLRTADRGDSLRACRQRCVDAWNATARKDGVCVAPSTIQCPNCGANQTDERGACHWCGTVYRDRKGK